MLQKIMSTSSKGEGLGRKAEKKSFLTLTKKKNISQSKTVTPKTIAVISKYSDFKICVAHSDQVLSS